MKNENYLVDYNNEGRIKLSNPIIINTFIASLNSLHKTQENKKRNNKKFMNLFSVKVQKYDDSSSHTKTEENKILKNSNITVRKKIKNLKKKNKIIESPPQEKYFANLIETVQVPEALNNDDYYECNNNSDSSLFTQKKLNLNNEKIKRTISLNKNEKLRLIKNKFNKQMDQAKLKKFKKEDMTGNIMKYKINPMDYIKYNMDSLENSNKSLNSPKENNQNQKSLINCYLIKNLNENKELILYNNKDDSDSNLKYDENCKCYYSLDHKSKIIYIKTSPQLLSSLSSYINSKICSKKETKNITMNVSKRSSSTPHEHNESLAFDHNSIIQKLKKIEKKRKEGEADILRSSDDSDIYSEDNL